MTSADQSAVKALRADLALQIARHVARTGQTQVAMAKRLAIPQPTMSKVMRGQVEAVSLELLLRIAVRAGLSVVLQTGRDPAEAGVYVSGSAPARSARAKSRLGEKARREVNEGARALSPEKRLEAHLQHSRLVSELSRAAAEYFGSRARNSP